ncbi:MAG: malate synthase G, partial [Thiotrichaceae bacterium]|nr:malate synthase G [Thiotrichaceae bacterium]
MMTERVTIAGLQIAKSLYELVKNEIAPGTGIAADDAWQSFSQLIEKMTIRNRSLLEKRDELQARIDAWHLEHKTQSLDSSAYKKYLYDIGYLQTAGADFKISSDNIDDEIATIAGPQLVVPISNARYALNAANARWGSLFDALYGTDAIAEEDGAQRGARFNPVRGAMVIAYAKNFLDQAVPLENGSYIDAIAYTLNNRQLSVILSSGEHTGLADATQFKGYQEKEGEITSLLLSNNNLHIEIDFNTDHPIHELHPTGIRDIFLESAITTIMDCEDSVAAIDADDKINVYRNWLGLMKGNLATVFSKHGETHTRTLNHNRRYLSPEGIYFEIPARSLMLIRNV